MAESLFTDQVPAETAADDGTPFTLGTLITADTAGTVDGIRWRFPAVLPDGSVVGVLYAYDTETTGTELASATFVAPVAGVWNTVLFASPVGISALTKYVAAVWTPNKYVYSGDFFVAALTNGHLTAPAHTAEQHNGKYHLGGATPTYPGSTFNENCYFVDVLFTPVGVEGALVVTLPALTASVTGSLSVAGAAAITLPALTSSATGGLTASGSAVVTLPALTAALVGASAVSGPMAVTLPALAISAAGGTGTTTPRIAAGTTARLAEGTTPRL